MKVRGKLTKTERALLALAAAFLAALALVYLRSAKAPAGADYTITTQRQPEGAPEAAEEPDAPEAAGPVDVNTAGLEKLDTLPGIGPVLAQRIIDDREANGPFASLEELLKVKGIGEATLEKFRDSAAVGLALTPQVLESAEEEAA